MLDGFITRMLEDFLIIYMTGVAVGGVVFRVRHAEGAISERATMFWRQALMHTLGWPVLFVRYLLS